MSNLRLALRSLWRAPGLTAAAVLVLAIGVAGGARTAVLTDGFWRREFGGDPSAVGRTLELDGRTYTIGGIMPADFHFPLLRQADVLLSMALDPADLKYRDRIWLTVIGRLK